VEMGLKKTLQDLKKSKNHWNLNSN